MVRRHHWLSGRGLEQTGREWLATVHEVAHKRVRHDLATKQQCARNSFTLCICLQSVRQVRPGDYCWVILTFSFHSKTENSRDYLLFLFFFFSYSLFSYCIYFCLAALGSCCERARRSSPFPRGSGTLGLHPCASWAQLLLGMWNGPRPGVTPTSPASAGGLSSAIPPGKSSLFFFFKQMCLIILLNILIQEICFNRLVWHQGHLAKIDFIEKWEVVIYSSDNWKAFCSREMITCSSVSFTNQLTI